jgi:hypothetical protein
MIIRISPRKTIIIALNYPIKREKQVSGLKPNDLNANSFVDAKVSKKFVVLVI